MSRASLAYSSWIDSAPVVSVRSTIRKAGRSSCWANDNFKSTVARITAPPNTATKRNPDKLNNLRISFTLHWLLIIPLGTRHLPATSNAPCVGMPIETDRSAARRRLDRSLGRGGTLQCDLTGYAIEAGMPDRSD